MKWWVRWRYAIRNFKNYPKELNRRAAVEQEMWDCWHEKRPLPDREKIADWARRLGIPDEFREK